MTRMAIARIAAALVNSRLRIVGGIVAARSPKSRSPERKSGYDFMARETRAMQDDDTANAGMLLGARRRGAVDAQSRRRGKSCADCHGDASTSMKGVAARYPAYQPGAEAAGQYRAAHQHLPH